MPNSLSEKIQNGIKQITGYMNLDCSVEIREEGIPEKQGLFVSVHTPDNGRFLIGKNGQSLRALEHLIRVMVSRSHPTASITVDVNDYRKSKTQYAVELARQAVARVRDTQKAEALLPMTAYERRIVHMELASHADIATESIGEEPQRRVVIKPFSEI